jgi:RecA/RadA recombinase
MIPTGMAATGDLTWATIQRRSLRAVEARLAAFVRAGKQGAPVSADPVPLPALGKRLEVRTGQKRRWYDQQYYAVDAERGAGEPADRHLVTFVRFDRDRVVFDVPAKSAAALRGVRRVRVFGVDGVRVRLAEDLRRALKGASKGKLVEALWLDTKPLTAPKRAPKGSTLDPSQRQALAALTKPGAAFVWGPPGTGKTKVIVEAVLEALAKDRTVLIASHTHVAVDNVLEGVVERSEIEPGDVVRVAGPLTEEKVSPRVIEHEFLLLRKAAEAVVGAAERREELDERAAVEGADQREIAADRADLETELRETREELLGDAKVVACTLASLCTQRDERRFDVVILDEAASIEPPYVVVAGSRAKRTFGLVGDFLQNAPIAEAADEKDDTVEDPWLADDVFSLAGITDRASAEAHPRCVALRRQYRFPSVIADLVNGFCYDGLLESDRASDAADGATITLLDTSALEERRLEPAFPRSWSNALGLELFAIVGGHHARDGRGVGYITPYRAQAERAQRMANERGLGIECGTAHRFQGRQFEVVVFDLMQDDRPRWAALADLHGDERQASGAKLLNVALTRTQQQLYLIADWSFVRRYDSPGMRALAALEDHPNFRVVDAREVLSWNARRT